MARIVLDIDGVALEELKALQKKDGRSIENIVAELLEEALAHRRGSGGVQALQWVSRPMHSLMDLCDREALLDALDSDEL